MSTLIQPETYVAQSKHKSFWQGVIATLPLCIAVIPWGILAGSYAIEVGLTSLESQAMSAIVFAGAAQLVALGMIKAGIGLTSILLTTLLITSRHLLYSMALRKDISPLPLKWRLSLGFLLTDELFAIVTTRKTANKQHEFDRWYALGGGLSFYVFWNIATLIGIIAGQTIPNMEEWGLDFAIASTFIALIIPMIKAKSILVCVLVSLVGSIVCSVLNIEAGLLISALIGMACGTLYAQMTGEAS
ncbi:AzlC family ABC transporter permease [Colwellia sp. UCD-KL20]|uniref:AzlC family ABC transporter permease n=1 Tax=Colwellia sp. UCD-KL20 TaxID=1917165 RepID=UPI0009712A61|nr:AzlC family ABC transporter permease [Colwellia sp. UCD-KL20]